jgi:hypothetical protein
MRRSGRPRRVQRVTNEQLKAMTPEAIARGMEAGTLRLPTVPDVDHVVPPGSGAQVIDHRVFHGLSFRQNAALHGELKPEDWWAPEDVVAWFMDEGA